MSQVSHATAARLQRLQSALQRCDGQTALNKTNHCLAGVKQQTAWQGSARPAKLEKKKTLCYIPNFLKDSLAELSETSRMASFPHLWQG